MKKIRVKRTALRPAGTLAAAGTLAVALVMLLGALNPAATQADHDYNRYCLTCPGHVNEGETQRFYIRSVRDDDNDTHFARELARMTVRIDYGTATAADLTTSFPLIRNAGIGDNFGITAADNDEANVDKTFTVRLTPTNLIADTSDPARDGECDMTIRDNDPQITDMGVYWTESATSYYEHENARNNRLMNTPCSGTFHFLAIFDPPRRSAADEWEAVIRDRGGSFSNARLIYRVRGTDRWPEIRGAIHGGASTGTGYFDVVVRPMYDGEWQAYSQPVTMLCRR